MIVELTVLSSYLKCWQFFSSFFKNKINICLPLCAQLLERIGPATEKLKGKGIDFSLWYKPEGYTADL